MRRRALPALRRAARYRSSSSSSSSSSPQAAATPPWGATTLEALCRRDQSGEALRVVASLALGVLRESERGGRATADGPPTRTPPPPRWHGLPVAAAYGVDEEPARPDAGEQSCWSPERMRQLAVAIQSGLIGREREATLLLLAGLAGEHALIIGPAGVGKSALAQRLAHLLCGRDAGGATGATDTGSDDDGGGSVYFERQLSRFSTPEELLGPLSISALKADEHTRCSTGYLLDPAIRVGFIDEILRGSTAILNTLL